MKGRFRITEYEEGRPMPSREDPVGKIRLVCLTDSHEKLVFWGKKGNTANIDKVRGAGLPCELECEYHEPQEWAKSQYEHKYWVAEDAHVTIV